MRHWLMKSEPSAYSIARLKKEGRTLWTGVRNYQARNFMTDGMQVGDLVLFYHSNAEPSGVAGLARVSGPAVADPTQFQRGELKEPRATKDEPVWRCVEIEFLEAAKKLVPLESLRAQKGLERMELLRKGSRLSVQPVTPEEFRVVAKLAGFTHAK